MFYDRFLQLCNERNIKPSRVAVELNFNKGSVSSWKKKYNNGEDVVPTLDIVKKIANYFDISIDYLLGNTDIKNPPEQQNPEDIAKSVLFGSCDVTDEMWESIKSYAEFVKQQKMQINNNL